MGVVLWESDHVIQALDQPCSKIHSTIHSQSHRDINDNTLYISNTSPTHKRHTHTHIGSDRIGSYHTTPHHLRYAQHSSPNYCNTVDGNALFIFVPIKRTPSFMLGSVLGDYAH
eukprot:m.14352 g.14352  ORF g.14352 m.14352 type:complete len:114 (-) comp10105_c0_seq1:220-561(-)